MFEASFRLRVAQRVSWTALLGASFDAHPGLDRHPAMVRIAALLMRE